MSLGSQGKATDVGWDVPLAPQADYEPLGVFLTRVPDPVYPWPEWQIRIIREFDPGFIPILRKKVYKSRAGGLHTFRHHGICRFDPEQYQHPDRSVVLCPVPMTGYGSGFGPANIIDRWFEDINHIRPGSKRALSNLPPPFIPWTDGILAWVRQCHWEAATKEKREFVERLEADRKEKAQREAQSESEYIQKNEIKYQKDLFDKLSPDDAKEFMARASGLYEEPSKPFSDLGARGTA